MHVQFIDLQNLSYQTSNHLSDHLVSMIPNPKIASRLCNIQSVNTLFIYPWPLQEKTVLLLYFTSHSGIERCGKACSRLQNDPLTKVWFNFLLTHKCFSQVKYVFSDNLYSYCPFKGKGKINCWRDFFFKLTDIRKLLVCHPARNNGLSVWFSTISDNFFDFTAKGIVLLDIL